MQPPPNPYDGFPSPNDPIQPYSQSTPQRGPELSFDVISQAWTVLQSSLGTYIGATFVAVILMAIMQIFSFAATRPGPQGEPQFNGGLYLVSILVSFFYSYILAGILRMAINHLRTGHADFVQVFSVYDVYPKLFISLILTVLGIYLGFCLCLVPGFLLSGLWMFVAPLIIDRRLGPIEAMRTSFNTLKPQMWMALLFMIVLSLLGQVGILACGVGLLFTAPLAIIALAITYRNFFPDGSDGFNFSPPNTNPPPIASPFG